MPKRKQIGSENLIGQKVVALRKERGMSQKELLARLQIHNLDLGQSALSDLEGQNRKVTDKEILALAEIFHISVGVLLGEEK